MTKEGEPCLWLCNVDSACKQYYFLVIFALFTCWC